MIPVAETATNMPLKVLTPVHGLVQQVVVVTHAKMKLPAIRVLMVSVNIQIPVMTVMETV